MKIFFFVSILVVFYTFIGYGMVLFILVKLKRRLRKPLSFSGPLPTCTLIVAAFNEEAFIKQKIANTLSLNYPEDRINYIFVTDGSNDGSPKIISNYPQINLLHQDKREGKIAAVHRAIGYAVSDVVVFTDANTLLNRDALIELCGQYADPAVGAVAGEKRVLIEEASDATAGEGFYWKYESKLKSWDYELYSVVGAAGELFSIRRALYQPVPPDSVLDDFMISMRIAEKGFKIAYQPKAFAMETASANIDEELKRKVRISAGGIQSIIYLKGLFNIFKYPVLSFQYISHRVLRWTVTPFLLIIAFILNIVIVLKQPGLFYYMLASLQILFYILALTGRIMESKQIRIKALFIPYYFCMMNYAVIAGIFRFFGSGQNVIWEKASRKQSSITEVKSA